MSNPGEKLTRRSMLSRSAQAAALAAVASRLESLFGAPRTRWFKIGACDWCIGGGGPAALSVAREIGLDGVQVSMNSGNPALDLRKPENREKYLQAVKETGMGIASLALGELNRIPLKSDPRAAELLAQSIGVCKALGLSIVMPACFGAANLDMGNTQEIDRVVKVLKDVAPDAEKQGVVIGVESYLSAGDNLKIIDRVGSPAIAVYYDVGNSTDKGYDILKEIRMLGKRICEFHAKDGPHMVGQGRIDFQQVRKAIDDIGYSGWIQLESARPHGLVPDYRAQYKYLRGIFPERG